MIWMCVGSRHLEAAVDVREKLAFSEPQACEALEILRRRYPELEVVILSTCNRVEIFAAMELPARGEDVAITDELLPADENNSAENLAAKDHAAEFPGDEDSAVKENPVTAEQNFPADGDAGCETLLLFLAKFHGVPVEELAGHTFKKTGRDAVEHLFTVISSLESMVVGEGQIYAQVKEAYQRSVACGAVGPLLNQAFQRAIRVAKCVTGQTGIHQRRTSIPSVAVSEFAGRIFERFETKKTLVIGAGKMAEETLLYLQEEGAKDITVINRNREHAETLAAKFAGKVRAWEELDDAVTAADLVISTTGATLPIMTRERFAPLESRRNYRPLFILDLAVPRDFDPKIGALANVYLYTVDDLRAVCEENLAAREKEIPRAKQIIRQELDAFIRDTRHRKSGEIIQRLRSQWKQPMELETERLFQKLPELTERQRQEIEYSFDRLVNKLLHLPMESLHHEAGSDSPEQRGLLDAIQKLFRLK